MFCALHRLQNETAANEVLESIENYFESQPFDFRDAQIISGQEEGIYGWITANYLMGNFLDPTQGSNPGLPHCRRIPYQLSHKRSPRILEWVAYPFSSPVDLPDPGIELVSLMSPALAGRVFTTRATWEAPDETHAAL